MPLTRGFHARKASAGLKRAGFRGKPRQSNFLSLKSASNSPDTLKEFEKKPRPGKPAPGTQSKRAPRKGKAGSGHRDKTRQKEKTFSATIDGANDEDSQEDNKFRAENEDGEEGLLTAVRQQLSHSQSHGQSQVHTSSVTELQSLLQPFHPHNPFQPLTTHQKRSHHQSQKKSQTFPERQKRLNMQDQQREAPRQGEAQPGYPYRFPTLTDQQREMNPQLPSSVSQNTFATGDLTKNQGFTGDMTDNTTGEPGYIAGQPGHYLDWSAQHMTQSSAAAFNSLAVGLTDEDFLLDHVSIPAELPFEVSLENIPSTSPPNSLQVSIPVLPDLWRECPSLSDTDEAHKLEKTMKFYLKLATTLKNWTQEQLRTIGRLQQRLVFEMGRRSADVFGSNPTSIPTPQSTLEANRAYSRAVALSIGVNYDQVFNTDMRASNVAERSNEEERLPVTTQNIDSGSAASAATKAYRVGAEQQSMSARLVGPAQSASMQGQVIIPSQTFRQQGPTDQGEQVQTQQGTIPQVNYGQYVALTRDEWQHFNNWLQSTRGGTVATGIPPILDPTTAMAAATTSPAKRKAQADQVVADGQEQGPPPKKRQRRNTAKDADGNDIVPATKPRKSRAKPKTNEEKATLEAEKAAKPRRAPRGAKKAADAAAAAATITAAATVDAENINNENESGSTNAVVSSAAGVKDALPANNIYGAEGSFSASGSTTVEPTTAATIRASAHDESDDVLLELADTVHDETHRLVDVTAGPVHDTDNDGDGDGNQGQKKQRHRKPLPRGAAVKKAGTAINERLTSKFGSDYVSAAEQEQMALLEASRQKFTGTVGSMAPSSSHTTGIVEEDENWDGYNLDDEDFDPEAL